MRDFDRAGRSVAHATEAMAATSHPLATATALDILRRDGTAMDAAIAAAAVLAVVEPAETGIGGDCFALYAPKGKMPPVGFNGSGRAPAAADLGWYLEREFQAIPVDGPHSVTVPGAVDAWWRLHDAFGRLEFAALLEPAIGYARSGYVVHERVGHEWQTSADRLKKDETARAIFLPSGRVPRVGEVMANPDLARTLSIVADKGRSGFYEGEVADALVGGLRALGGLHTLEDFAATAGDFVNPISAQYGERDVFQMPPNTQGAIALLILRLIALHAPGEMDFLSPERVHLGIEAGKIAYACRNALLGDCDRSDHLLQVLNDRKQVQALAGWIRPGEARCDLPPIVATGANTVYLSVVDAEHNVVSFINSIFHSFGSGICPAGTGVLLQNRGHGFQLDPRHPGAIGPSRRPQHTILPGMVGHDSRVDLSFGVMGGDYQPMGHAHVLTAIYDHGFDLQAACDAPRYMPVMDKVRVESSLDGAICETLERWGHKMTVACEPLGGAQIISIDWQSGTLSGSSDPRKDGCALGY